MVHGNKFCHEREGSICEKVHNSIVSDSVIVIVGASGAYAGTATPSVPVSGISCDNMCGWRYRDAGFRYS